MINCLISCVKLSKKLNNLISSINEPSDTRFGKFRSGLPASVRLCPGNLKYSRTRQYLWVLARGKSRLTDYVKQFYVNFHPGTARARTLPANISQGHEMSENRVPSVIPTIIPPGLPHNFPHNPANFPTYINLLPSSSFLSQSPSPEYLIFLVHLSFFKSRLYNNYQLLWLRHRTLLAPLRSTTLSSALISRKLYVMILTVAKRLLSTC